MGCVALKVAGKPVQSLSAFKRVIAKKVRNIRLILNGKLTFISYNSETNPMETQ